MGEDEIKEGLETAFDFLYFREKVKKHWIIVLIAIAACVTAFIGGIFLINNFTVNTIIGGWGINYIQNFSVGTLFYATLWIILWFIVLIALPTFGFLGTLFGLYWKVLMDEEEKIELKERGKLFKEREKKRRKWKERHGEQAGVFSGAVGLVVAIKLAVEGNWLVTFENLSTQYILNVWITAVIWISAIIGILAVIFGLLFFLYKKE